MTFVTQFNYFKKSIDSIFYSTPKIFGKRIRDAALSIFFYLFTFAA